jgi:tetratricopeptide (TPR) repeat protein
MMKRTSRWTGALWVGVMLLLGTSAAAWAAPQQQAQPAAKPAYTLAEYNAYQAAHNEQNVTQRMKLLDDFVMKYPMSALLPYAYRDYYLGYYAGKDYAKAIDYADKELALGDKVDIGTRLEAYIVWAQGFLAGQSDKTLQAPEMLTKTKNAQADGLKTLAAWQKPDKMTDEQYAKQKSGTGILFNSIAGMAESGLKDYKSAQASYRAALAIDPNDAVTHFRLGVADLQDMPPQSVDGFWELSRSIALKGPGEQQVRAYLRSQLLHYQQPSCEKLGDDEISELVTLGASSNDRPATLTIPSADDLQKARDDTMDFLPWLQEGGDHGKTMWLATCGLEYPDVAVRVMNIMPGDNDGFTLDVFRAATQEAMQAATAPNMQVHIVAQPDVKRIMKDDQIRFTGTLSAYTQNPFLLTWDNGKVNPEDLEPDKPAPGAAKKPAGRPAAPKKPAQ